MDTAKFENYSERESEAPPKIGLLFLSPTNGRESKYLRRNERRCMNLQRKWLYHNGVI